MPQRLAKFVALKGNIRKESNIVVWAACEVQQPAKLQRHSEAPASFPPNLTNSAHRSPPQLLAQLPKNNAAESFAKPVPKLLEVLRSFGKLW